MARKLRFSRNILPRKGAGNPEKFEPPPTQPTMMSGQ